MTATDSAARSPSTILIACRSRVIGSLERFRLRVTDDCAEQTPHRRHVRHEGLASTSHSSAPAPPPRHGRRKPAHAEMVEPAELSSLGHTAQHVMQDTAVTVVRYLIHRIDSAKHRHLIGLPVGAMDDEREIHPGRQTLEPENIDRLLSGESEALSVHPVFIGKRQYPHSDEIGAMNALKTFDDDRLDPEQHRALRCPIAR